MTRFPSTGVRRPSAPVTMVVLLALALGAPVAEAGKPKKKERTVQEVYVGATGVRGVQDSPCAGEPVGCIRFPIEPGERFVTIEVTDAAGGNVWASVYAYGYSDGTDLHEHVCGTSESPIRLAPGVDELVVVITQTTGGATNACDGAATQGTVTAVFSNR